MRANRGSRATACAVACFIAGAVTLSVLLTVLSVPLSAQTASGLPGVTISGLGTSGRVPVTPTFGGRSVVPSALPGPESPPASPATGGGGNRTPAAPGGLHQGAWLPVAPGWFPEPGPPPPLIGLNRSSARPMPSDLPPTNGPQQPVPEPETVAIFCMGLAAAAWVVWQRRSRAPILATQDS